MGTLTPGELRQARGVSWSCQENREDIQPGLVTSQRLDFTQCSEGSKYSSHLLQASKGWVFSFTFIYLFNLAVLGLGHGMQNLHCIM